MGVGRFVYTPILPLMTAQAGLSLSSAASLATANYLGYFVGALATVVRAPSRAANRVALVLLVATLAGMPLTHGMAAWFVLRLLAGVASAVVFVAAVNSRPGWGMSGVGVGIALSGVLVLVWGQWQAAWWVSAGLAALLAVWAWALEPDVRGADARGVDTAAEAQPDASELSDLPETIGVGARLPLGAGESGSIQDPREGGSPRQTARPSQPARQTTRASRSTRRAFAFLFAAYTLEGVGYIIAATFLVAAISGPLGGSAWILVGLSAALSPILIKPSRNALPAALAVQAIGIALPAAIAGSALIGTILFGGTFIGVAATALKQGTDLGFPRAAATLTAGYSAGQVLGPLLATPLLHNGYNHALLLAAAIVALAAVTAPAPPSRRRLASRTPRRSPPAAPAE
ncbi:MFS transporter [Lentzea cavernae]|uniref:MFS transporter n=2 Tax=Lentzea cavernae TaxID=2020703 RepID=A0ABQ3M3L2_9PSEU|nr:MFS transporter [Lentzea cavernae]